MRKRPYQILVAIDFSPPSEIALEEAVSLATRTWGEIDLLHVYPAAAPITDGRRFVDPRVAGELVSAQRSLDEIRRMHMPSGLTVRTHVRVGDPASGIVDAAEAFGSDVVVVGSHGRGLFERALIGSVSEQVAKTCTRSVMVVPAPSRLARLASTVDAKAALPPPPLAWSCTRCGHIRGPREAEDRCRRCDLFPAQWSSVPILPRPDEVEAPLGPAVEPARAER